MTGPRFSMSGRAALLIGCVGALILAVVLVYVVLTPNLAWPGINPPATNAGQSAGTPFGLTPFTDWAVSIGLCVVAAVVVAIVARELWVRFASPTPRRLSRMIQHRPRWPEPRTLEGLVEQLIEVHNRQYAGIMQRLEELERASNFSEPHASVSRAIPAPAWREEADAPTRHAEPAPAPVLRQQTPARAAEPPPTPSGGDPRLMQALEQEFRSLLAEPSGTEFRDFFDTHHAVSLEASAGRLAEGGGRSALVFALPVGRGVHLLFPSHEIASDFGSVYHAQRAMPEEIKLAFDLDIDGSRVLKLTAPAEAALTGDLCTIRRRGCLGGLTA